MKKYLIILNGCDDHTDCEIELSDEEIELFVKIAEKINKHSRYQCQPTISVYNDFERTDELGHYIFYKYDDQKDLLGVYVNEKD